MPVPRLLPVFLSVLLAVGLWFYGAVRLQTTGLRRGGYATLAFDDGYSDREIRDRLDGKGLTGLVSESDQWFLLDCFGYIEKVPLADFKERLLPFDPRNDGYAEKLESLFVRDGKRFVYIPIGTNNPENLDAVIAEALTGVSYSLDYTHPPPGRDILLPLIAFCLTACAFFVIPVLRRRLNNGFLPCMLSLSPLAFGLAPGFALAALLAGFAALFSGSFGQKQPFGRQGARDLPGSFTAHWLPALALIACYILFSFFSGLPVLFVFLVLASFCFLLLVSLKAGGNKISIKFNANIKPPQSRRFVPVEIISRRNTVSYGFFPVMLPFAVMALALAFVGFAMPQPPSPPVVNVSPLPVGAITEADFQEHYLFQSAFSFRALGKTYEAGELPVIAGYELSSNGLLAPAAPSIDEEIQMPDFPLGDLLRGISSDDSPHQADEGNHSNAASWLFAPLPLLFILPSFIHSIWKKRQGKIRTGFAGFYR
jgi:hypothetical protein